jgi:uncharacterized repeat protein (TIGR01451 family)
MRSFSLLAILFFLTSLSVSAQFFPQAWNEMRVIQSPTCNNANGSVVFVDSLGPVSEYLVLYSLPDSVLIGTGSSYSGLKQGPYFTKQFYPDGRILYTDHFLSNFKYLQNARYMFDIFMSSAILDTCSRGKGEVRLGQFHEEYVGDTLNLIQWSWSNGQTGTNATGLKAGETYWLKGSLGSGCPFYFPHSTQYLKYLEDNAVYNDFPFRHIRVHHDTLFFVLENAHTFNVGFVNAIQPLCESPTGSVTASVSNGGVPPFQYKWSNGSEAITLTNAKAGSYAVQVMDSVGCKGYGGYNLNSKSALGFNVFVSAQPDSCFFGRGKATAFVIGGVKPYKFYWKYGQPFSLDSTITGLPAGHKNLYVSDSNGCAVWKSYTMLNENPLQPLISQQNPNCSGTMGKISVTGIGGVEPYHMDWIGYPERHGLVLDSLIPASYSGFLVDNNGCKTRIDTYLQIPNECYQSVSLGVHREEDGECTKGPSELPVYNNAIQYKLLNETRYLTSELWFSNILVLPGIQDFKLSPKPNFSPTCLDANWKLTDFMVNSGQPNTYKDIGLGMAGSVRNYTPRIYQSPGQAFRPGFNSNFILEVENSGNQPLPNNGHLLLTLQPGVSFVYSEFPHTLESNSAVRFPVSAPALGYKLRIPIKVKLDSATPLGVLIPFILDLDTLQDESVVSDNHAIFQFMTRGAYDPNDISANPSPFINRNQTRIDYQIRFQNLGTYYAENVVIIDTLPDNVDPSTFYPGYSKHSPSSIEVKGRILTIRYKYINLPPKIWDEPSSHGEFNYTIHRIPDLFPGTKIHNSASIYFDFNAPVKTNTSEVQVNETMSYEEKLTIYPNPGDDHFRIIGSVATEMDVFDVTGKRMLHLNSSGNRRFSLESVPDGLYFLRFREGGKYRSLKLMVQKK